MKILGSRDDKRGSLVNFATGRPLLLEDSQGSLGESEACWYFFNIRLKLW